MEGGLNKLLLETSMGANSNDKSFDYSMSKGVGTNVASKSRKKHNRGRSLLEIKNEVSQRTSKIGSVVFGNNFGQGMSKDATNDISRS